MWFDYLNLCPFINFQIPGFGGYKAYGLLKGTFFGGSEVHYIFASQMYSIVFFIPFLDIITKNVTGVFSGWCGG